MTGLGEEMTRLLFIVALLSLAGGWIRGDPQRHSGAILTWWTPWGLLPRMGVFCSLLLLRAASGRKMGNRFLFAYPSTLPTLN